MPFQDLVEVLDPYLDLPINGKTYRVASVDADTGLRMQATVAVAVKVKAGEQVTEADVASLQLDDAEEREFVRSALGDALDQMRTDNVPWVYIKHAAQTVFMWTVSDRESAERVWSSGEEQPASARPATSDHKPKKTSKKASSRSSSTRRRTPASSGGAGSSSGA